MTRVYINEVASRDGFQNEAVFIPTDEKISFINTLSESGYAKIEVTSFTSPKAIPALKDAEVVMHEIHRNPDVVYTALVPNLRGAERAYDSQVQEFNLVMSLSETHNRANLRMRREGSFEQLKTVIDTYQDKVSINVSFSTVFGCPMEGDIAVSDVLAWIEKFSHIGVNKFTLCDTTGMAYPKQVQDLFAQVKKHFPETDITAHFHNTRGMALANTMAALDEGIIRFDASLGGLGGCPYAPGASGNVSTEDLVHMLALNGYDTGVNLSKICALAQQLPRLIQHDISSQVSKAGPRSRLYPAPDYIQTI
ncbi:hydroxymethylglutaryl-CoA lyase [Pelistega indica]|uniref:Hydroxymethylglutaryl-CoA lyase n=1 Tax=Pelistega indica TaxID=1414851 RepID=V8G3Q1_9BURK|nr:MULTISPECIES: hydroxymethylglutaryl-CoA lyase [Pelistega]ETD70573.1 hydroxymethylglutaryl-CoA lyase [Pelistega indica]